MKVRKDSCEEHPCIFSASFWVGYGCTTVILVRDQPARGFMGSMDDCK